MPTPEQNLEGIFFEAGWWHPGCAIDGRAAKYLAQRFDAAPAIKLLPKNRRRTCVQAGANVGAWPIALAGSFQRVVTFEPDEANWICLQRNMDAHSKCRGRIEAHNTALGPAPGVGQLLFNRCNPYAHKFRFRGQTVEVAPKYEVMELSVVEAIDDLGLEDLDLLCLDIEGAEWPAMLGGEQTIERCRPIILYEEREHGAVYGYKPEELRAWLRERGYQHAGTVGKDQMWLP